ncbi:RNA-directed DNA polymerase [Candidatus Parcubacteria bacterium]|nr:RNA-directed DNA polymerase [Candidatus Parcubacteria bacterium]
MNEFDQFVKHKLKAAYYIRYADDFVIFSSHKDELAHMRHGVNMFLREKLKLSLHPDKVFIKTLSSGVDFLGWVHFPHHRVLRTVTKRRMKRNLARNPSEETKASYKGLLKYGNTQKLRKMIM